LAREAINVGEGVHSMSSTHGAEKAVQADADLEMLSAWLDGELEPGQQRAMLDRLKSDPGLRTQFEWFNLAGDALRSHEVAACHLPGLAGKVSRALASEPVRLGGAGLSGSPLRRYIGTGLTLAAAAVTLVVVALPQLRGTEVVPVPQSIVSANPTSAVRPVAAVPANSLPAQTPQLDAYFRAHRELATTGVMPSSAAYIRMSSEPDR
jgi:Anti sigma-E protein RseA, N-terminal domain